MDPIQKCFGYCKSWQSAARIRLDHIIILDLTSHIWYGAILPKKARIILCKTSQDPIRFWLIDSGFWPKWIRSGSKPVYRNHWVHFGQHFRADLDQIQRVYVVRASSPGQYSWNLDKKNEHIHKTWIKKWTYKQRTIVKQNAWLSGFMSVSSICWT